MLSIVIVSQSAEARVAETVDDEEDIKSLTHLNITFWQIDRYKEGFRVSEVYRIPQLLIVGICGYLWAFLGICGPTWCKVAGWLGIWGIRWQCGGKGRGSVHLRDLGGHCRWCRWLALVSSSRQRTPLYHQVGDTHTPAAAARLSLGLLQFVRQTCNCNWRFSPLAQTFFYPLNIWC